LKLFQYWNDATPPDDVAAWIEDIRRDNPDFEHVLLDETSGARFVAQHYGPREVAAFRACVQPAMQADLLRLCLMDAEGGLYIDADHQSHEPLAGMIVDAPHALLPIWNNVFATGIMMFRRPGNRFVRACLEVAVDNIAARRFPNVLIATGPGLFNAVRCVIDPSVRPGVETLVGLSDWGRWGWDELIARAEQMVQPSPELAADMAAITLVESGSTMRWLGIAPPAYKSTERHWLNFTGELYR
jgi:hypothetical protein